MNDSARETLAADLGGSGLNPEFARLAAARRIVTSVPSAESGLHDRVAAERWIRRVATGDHRSHGDAAGIHQDGGRIVVRPPRVAPDRPRILYIHGGGMVYYSTDVFRPLLRLLASELESVVETFDYLKVPEHTVDRSVQDLSERLSARCDELDPQPLILAGDSVGGLLGLYLASRVLHQTFQRVVLIYPVLDLWTERESYREFGNRYFLDAAAMRSFKAFLTPCFEAHNFDPFNMSDAELAGVSSYSLVTAGCDVLCDEGLAWVGHLRQRGVEVLHQHFADLPHDFCLYSGKLACAREAVHSIAKTAFNVEPVA